MAVHTFLIMVHQHEIRRVFKIFFQWKYEIFRAVSFCSELHYRNSARSYTIEIEKKKIFSAYASSQNETAVPYMHGRKNITRMELM